MQVSGIVDLCGGERNFLRSVDDALRATERDEMFGFEEGEVEEGLGLRMSQEHSGPAPQPEQDPFSRIGS